VGRGYRFIARVSEEAEGDAALANPGSGVGSVSAEELGRAIMTAAGLDPENPFDTSKVPRKS
jgi:hypothetical protein